MGLDCSAIGLIKPRMSRLPPVVVFDLDGTLWSPEMYELWGGGAPFKSQRNGAHVTDSKNVKVELLGASREVMESLSTSQQFKSGELTLALASTCDEPAWARECLTKFMLHDGATQMGEIFAVHEIYKARDKTVHFQAIKKKTGRDFGEMIFFDNQTNNINDVSPLGVVCVYCPDGVTSEVWAKGLAKYHASRKPQA